MADNDEEVYDIYSQKDVIDSKYCMTELKWYFKKREISIRLETQLYELIGSINVKFDGIPHKNPMMKNNDLIKIQLIIPELYLNEIIEKLKQYNNLLCLNIGAII